MALTSRLLERNETVWTEFHREYAPRLFRYLLVVSGGREDVATEALQQTWIRCVRHIRRFDSEEALWSWLTVLGRSSVTDEHRRHSRFHGFLQRMFETFPDRLLHLGVPDGEAELIDVLTTEMEELPPDERRLLEAKYASHHSTRDLAANLATTEKAVESRLARLRIKLREAVLKKLQDRPGNEH